MSEENQEIQKIRSKLTELAQGMGYVNWNFIVFAPMVRMDDVKVEYSRILSQLSSNNDIYELGQIMIRMLEKMVEKGYFKFKDDKGQINA